MRLYRAEINRREFARYGLLFLVIGIFLPLLISDKDYRKEEPEYNYPLPVIILFGFPLYFGLVELAGFTILIIIKSVIDIQRKRIKIDR